MLFRALVRNTDDFVVGPQVAFGRGTHLHVSPVKHGLATTRVRRPEVRTMDSYVVIILISDIFPSCVRIQDHICPFQIS